MSKTITTTTKAADPDRKDEEGNWPGWDTFTLTITSCPDLFCLRCGVKKIYLLQHPNWTERSGQTYICAVCKEGFIIGSPGLVFGGHILPDVLRAIEEAGL